MLSCCQVTTHKECCSHCLANGIGDFASRLTIKEKWQAWTSFPSPHLFRSHSHCLKVSLNQLFFFFLKEAFQESQRSAFMPLMHRLGQSSGEETTKKKKHLWLDVLSVWRMDTQSGVVTSRHHGEMSSILPWCCRFFCSLAPGRPSLPISSRLPAHAVKSSAQQCTPLWARGLIRGGSSSRCPPLPEFQLCQRRCRGVGLNWRTSTKAQKGSSSQFGDILSFILYGRTVGYQATKNFSLQILKKKEWNAFITKDILRN